MIKLETNVEDSISDKNILYISECKHHLMN